MSVPFDPKELRVVAVVPPLNPELPPVPLYDFPVSMHDGYKALTDRKPIWQVTGIEVAYFIPKVYPDSIARALVLDAQELAPEERGGKDMFGIEWEFVPVANGSMVKPGNPLLDDANEWPDKVVWPDIGSWDWAGSIEANKGYLKSENFNSCWIFTGWYERLISFMDFEGAAIALIDEDQTDAVKDLFGHLSDLYIKFCDKVIESFPEIDGFYVHDDWGSQNAPFFSSAVAEELIVPAMRKFTDHVHSRGRVCELHSCGKIEQQVPNLIEAGWDVWNGQPMNDSQKLYELYGDGMIIGVMPDPIAPNASEE
ncbi:MAG: methyltransferase, partial [Actinobacteria bacterium]|nr:methyltransferase [Actinomycetota bacterium]